MKTENLLPQDAYFAVSKISSCQEEEEVAKLTKKAVQALGAASYVYSTLTKDDRTDGRESYRYFIGCDPLWCRIYNDRKWFMNDPFIEHARNNVEPIMGSKIILKTEGQKEMLRTASEFGFKSGMVVPTHSSHGSKERLGILYIGVDKPPEIGEPLIGRHKVFYRSLGMELLDWWIRYLRNDVIRKYKLSANEVETLALLKNGNVVAEISARLDVTPSKIYRQIGIIKDKFNVDKIVDAISIAAFAGLF